jgi:hypothetical protein
MPISIHTSLKAKSFGRKKTTLGVLQRAAFGLTTFDTETQYRPEFSHGVVTGEFLRFRLLDALSQHEELGKVRE